MWMCIVGPLLLLSPVSPLVGEPNAEAFLAELILVADLVAANEPGSAQEAQDLLNAALYEHRGKDYVRYELGRLRELAARCAFGVEYERPDDLQAALGCAKKPKISRSGLVELGFKSNGPRNVQASAGVLEYAGEFPFFPRGFTLGDDGILYSDVSFVGKCQITIEGKLPSSGPGREHPPQVVLKVDGSSSYVVDYTWPTTYAPTIPGWTQGFIERWKNGEPTRVTTDIITGKRFKMMWDKKYDIQLVAKKDAVAATANGMSLLTASRPKGGYGRFGFRCCPRVSEITLKGIVDDDAVEGVYVRHRARREAAFVAAADATELLPSWVFATAQIEEPETEGEGR